MRRTADTGTGEAGNKQAWLLTGLFVLTALIPNAVLAFTEPYRATTIAASLLIPAGINLAWCMVARRTGKMVLFAIPVIILYAFQLVISYLFGNSIIAVDMFTNLVTTNASEAGELLSGIYPAVVIVCVIYIPVIVFAVISFRRRQGIGKQARRKGLLAAGAMALTGSVLALMSYGANRHFSVKEHIFPFNVCHNIGLSAERWFMAKKYPKNVEDFTFGAERDKTTEGREIYVLVIGEASRAASWGLYGYERNTTPHLDTISGKIVFRDVFTQSNTTHKSVPIILSAASAENYGDIYHMKGLCALFSEAGFRTAFITNQPPNRALTGYLEAEADTLIRVTSWKDKDAVQHYDGEAVPILRDLIDSCADDLFVVIHTYGSHAKHQKRYPREYAVFIPDEPPSISPDHRDILRNAYDNSIVYTDHVLSEVIGTLRETDAVTSLMYCSDHGEDVMDDDRNRFLHASPTTTYYQLHVPAFIWISDNYLRRDSAVAVYTFMNSDKPAGTGDLFHTMGAIAGIKSRYIDETRSWLSPGFSPSERLYVNDYDDAVDIMKTGLTEEDINLMESRGLYFDVSKYEKEVF